MRLASIVGAAALACVAGAVPMDIMQFLGSKLTQSSEYFQGLSSKHELLSFHKSLIEINSVSGDEYEVYKYLASYLSSKGLTVESQQVEDKRFNIYAYYGSQPNTTVLLTTHIDTVPPYFPYFIEDGKIYGRGSVDAKASIATQVVALLELLSAGKVQEGDVALLFVVGEEVNGAGMHYASEHLPYHWDHAVFGEPTENKLGVGHKGVYSFNLEVEGKASHSGYPELGIDANSKLIDVLGKIIHNDEYPADELLGKTTLNPGFIQGGVAGNVLSAHASSKVVVRVANNAHKVRDIIRNIVQIENEQYNNINLIEHQVFEPVYLNYSIPNFESGVMAYFTDVPNLKDHGIRSRYLYGPGTITLAHSADEYIYFDDLARAVRGYKDIVDYLLSV